VAPVAIAWNPACQAVIAAAWADEPEPDSVPVTELKSDVVTGAIVVAEPTVVAGAELPAAVVAGAIVVAGAAAVVAGAAAVAAGAAVVAAVLSSSSPQAASAIAATAANAANRFEEIFTRGAPIVFTVGWKLLSLRRER
jgi:hypothetical protein